ncbi:MAG: glycosyl hydrolase [Steroidobacteraceae bacterium]
MARVGWLALVAVLAASAAAMHVLGREAPHFRLPQGSLAAVPPPDSPLPPPPAFAAAELRPPFPTSRWWSSLVALPFSERQYPHPLAVVARAEGLQVRYPGPDIRATDACICGWMDFDPPTDLILGHSGVPRFEAARLGGWNDWFVRARFEKGSASMQVSYGHGSPIVYATFGGGDPVVRFPSPPEVFHEADGVLGVCRDRRCYLLVGPAQSRWSGVGTAELRNWLGGAGGFAVALLPDGQRMQAVERFTRAARTPVENTSVAWTVDEAHARVRVRFSYSLAAGQAKRATNLFALYPHQSAALVDAAARPELGSYTTVRGRMSLREGEAFELDHPFPGVLPALPVIPGTDLEALRALVKRDAAVVSDPRDTYWAGKELGRLAALHALAIQLELHDDARALESRLRQRLEAWFDARYDPAEPATAGTFYYDKRWGTLIGYPSSHGSAAALNDHHFHYGYFLRAAAELGRSDPAWLGPAAYGPFVDLLIRDIASARRDDPAFPFLRHFDPYAGHSWASGDGIAGDGNNQESSSEALAAWTALVLIGEIRGDRTLRDTGIYLYSSELAAVEAYWFDVERRNFPAGYPHPVVPMIWGGKGAYGTYFSAEPEALHGINWLPFHGGSLYLGRYPQFARRSYEALLAARGGANWKMWPDLMVMYRALTDPVDAQRQWVDVARVAPEAGNSRSNVAAWLSMLSLAGQVDRAISADTPLYAVFRDAAHRTYVAYNMHRAVRTVHFSDGAILEVQPGAFGTLVQPLAGGTAGQ